MLLLIRGAGIKLSIRWFMHLAFFLCMGSALAQGGSLNPEAYPKDVRRVLQRGTLIVAMLNTDQPPFFSVQDGKLMGADVQLAGDLAKAMGVNVRFDRDARTFDEVVDMVADRKADVGISKLSQTFRRSLRVRFSDTYLVLRQAMLINRLRLAQLAVGRQSQDLIKRFPGNIGVPKSSSYVQWAFENFPKARIVEYPDWGEAELAVKAGRVDALYMDEVEIKRIAQADPRNPLTLKTIVFTDTNDALAIAVQHEDIQLLSAINLFLRQRSQPLDAKRLVELTPSK